MWVTLQVGRGKPKQTNPAAIKMTSAAVSLFAEDTSSVGCGLYKQNYNITRLNEEFSTRRCLLYANRTKV